MRVNASIGGALKETLPSSAMSWAGFSLPPRDAPDGCELCSVTSLFGICVHHSDKEVSCPMHLPQATVGLHTTTEGKSAAARGAWHPRRDAAGPRSPAQPQPLSRHPRRALEEWVHTLNIDISRDQRNRECHSLRPSHVIPALFPQGETRKTQEASRGTRFPVEETVAEEFEC